MKEISPFILLIFTFSTLNAQNKMRSIEELINKSEPGWVLVEKWISEATNKVEVLPVDTLKGKDALYKTQVTTRSPMGTLVYSTGGLLIDNGWIRILGSGHPRLNRTLPDWNIGRSINEFGENPPFLLIADDAIGGFFAINGGRWKESPGKVYYLSPDNLEWENLDLTYTAFLQFCFNSNLNEFYKGLRWDNWETEVSAIDGSQAFTFYPFLWTKEGKDINKNKRKAVPVAEMYSLNLNFQVQLSIKP